MSDTEENIGGKPNGGEPHVVLSKPVSLENAQVEQTHYLGIYLMNEGSEWYATGLAQSVDEAIKNLANLGDSVYKARIVEIPLPPPFPSNIKFV